MRVTGTRLLAEPIIRPRMDGRMGGNLISTLFGITSFSKDHRELQNLPPGAPVIRLGQPFDDGLAEIVIGLGLA